MKKIFAIIIAALVIVAITVTVIPAHAGDSGSAVVDATEAITEVTVTEGTAPIAETVTLDINSAAANEIVEIIEQSDSRAEAILSIAEKLGITAEQAENILNTVIDVGDEYLGETEWWVGFKRDVQEDIQFWTTAIVLVCAVVAMIGGVFVLLAKVNPNVKKAMWGMQEALQITKSAKDENSQTLGELKEIFLKAAEKEEIFEKLIEQKEEVIKTLTEKIKDLEEKSEAERINMVSAEIYNLRILKLICDRTAMPLTDKATIDLFYAKGLDALKAELSAEDVEKIEKTLSTLDTVGDVRD